MVTQKYLNTAEVTPVFSAGGHIPFSLHLSLIVLGMYTLVDREKQTLPLGLCQVRHKATQHINTQLVFVYKDITPWFPTQKGVEEQKKKRI